MGSDRPDAGGCREERRERDRSWLDEAIRKVEADSNRSADTHLLVFPLPEDTEVDVHPEFTMSISDIRELRKVGGYGWKSKMVIGWATGREVLDGLEITDKDGKKVILTTIKGRDELFNRLLSMGNHKWEAY